MKTKTLLILFVTLVLISAPKAQILKQYGFKIGASSSYQTAVTFINSETSSSESRLGINAGVYAVFLKNNHINLLTELHFIQKGTKFVISDNYNLPERTGETEYTTINYLSIPVMVKLEIPSKILSPYIIGGPRMDYMLSYNENILNGYYKSINKVNWGITFGVGLSKKITKKSSLLFEIRYSKDFTSFTNTEFHIGNQLVNYGNEVGIKIKNASLDFLFGMSF